MCVFCPRLCAQPRERTLGHNFILKASQDIVLIRPDGTRYYDSEEGLSAEPVSKGELVEVQWCDILSGYVVTEGYFEKNDPDFLKMKEAVKEGSIMHIYKHVPPIKFESGDEK
jgi:hypothetical protein